MLGIASRNDGSTDACGFLAFARQFKIFPTLTKESVVRRIAQYMRSRMDDGVGCFYASLVLKFSFSSLRNVDIFRFDPI